MSLLVTDRGLPQPPQDVVQRLRQVHPTLGLRFVPGMDGQWAVTRDWREDDPRHAYVQRGELPPDECHDIVGYIPRDCAVEDVPALVAERWRRNITQDGMQELLDGLHRYNKQVEDAAFQPIVDEAMNEIEIKAGRLFAGMGKATAKVGPATGKGKK